MRSLQKQPGPVMRLMAVASLVLWLAASGICSVECAGGFQHCAGGAHSCCHRQSAATPGQPHGSEPQHGHDSSLCISLHSLYAPAMSVPAAGPDATLAFMLDFISTARWALASPVEASASRQSGRGDSAFRPEVSLGAASLSHAPPALS